jgi:hypothetical protein
MKNNHRRFVLVALLIMVGMLALGCKTKPVPPPQPTAASQQRVQEIRAAYFRAYPDSRVGVINVVDKAHKLVSVAEVNGADFREGETIVIIDERQKVLCNGTIVRVLSNMVHVAYEKAKGGRDPIVGDMMVRIPPGGTTL